MAQQTTVHFATILDTIGQGNANVYIRVSDPSNNFWNFTTLAFDAVESAQTKSFLTEFNEGDPLMSRYQANVSVPLWPTDLLIEYVRDNTNEAIGEETLQGYAPAYVPPTVTPPAPLPFEPKAAVGTEDIRAIEATASFERYEPLITVDQLKNRFLFGIPLVSAIPDPITKKRQVMTDHDLKDGIRRAVGRIEEFVGIRITEVKFTQRLPFDRAEYKSLGFFRLSEAPILRVYDLRVSTADSQAVYIVPLNWLDPGQFHKGQVNIVPLMPAFVGSGGTLPTFDGGAAWLSILGQAGWVPSYWQITFAAGFSEGHIPSAVNDLIGLEAAIEVLERLAATNRVQSYSLGLDAANQSVSTGGPAIYDKPLEKMTANRDKLVNKLKAKFFKKFVVSNV